MGVEVLLLSTRKPSPIICRHDFVTAVAETRYLFPPSIAYQASWMMAGCRGLPSLLTYVGKLKKTGLKDRIRQLGLLTAAIELLQWSRREKIDHIHGHSCADAAHVLAMSRWAGGPPYSLTLHGDLEIYGTDHAAKMEKAAFIATVGSHLRTEVMDAAKVPFDRTLVTCMGVKTSNLEKLGKARSTFPGSLHLVTVARLHRAKAHVNALLAISTRSRARPGLAIHDRR